MNFHTLEIGLACNRQLLELKQRALRNDGDAIVLLYKIACESVDALKEVAFAHPETLKQAASRYPIFPAMICSTSARDDEHRELLKLLEVGKGGLLNPDHAAAITFETIQKKTALILLEWASQEKALGKPKFVDLPEFTKSTSDKWFELAKEFLRTLPPKELEKHPDWKGIVANATRPADKRIAIFKEIRRAFKTLARK